MIICVAIQVQFERNGRKGETVIHGLRHANSISFDNRPFVSVEEMNEALIQNWNARVTPDDTVYVLGDMFFKYKQSNTPIMASLNGHKHLIK